MNKIIKQDIINSLKKNLNYDNIEDIINELNKNIKHDFNIKLINKGYKLYEAYVNIIGTSTKCYGFGRQKYEALLHCLINYVDHMLNDDEDNIDPIKECLKIFADCSDNNQYIANISSDNNSKKIINADNELINKQSNYNESNTNNKKFKILNKTCIKNDKNKILRNRSANETLNKTNIIDNKYYKTDICKLISNNILPISKKIKTNKYKNPNFVIKKSSLNFNRLKTKLLNKNTINMSKKINIDSAKNNYEIVNNHIDQENKEILNLLNKDNSLIICNNKEFTIESVVYNKYTIQFDKIIKEKDNIIIEMCKMIDDVNYQLKKIELKLKELEKCPDYLICPISLQRFNSPVISNEGHSYEKWAIDKWLISQQKSPITGLKLNTITLINNYAIKAASDDFNVRNNCIKLIRKEINKFVTKCQYDLIDIKKFN